MAKKKHPRLPNGFGQICRLSGNRNNPYAVYPPSDQFDRNGRYLRKKALCYVSEWLIGFAVLTAYRAGTYTPGMELEIAEDYYKDQQQEKDRSVISRILADYSACAAAVRGKEPEKTFSQVYQEFYTWKFERKGARAYSKKSVYAMQNAFNRSSALHDRPFASIRAVDLQAVVDACDKKHATKETLCNLFHGMYKYADLAGICSIDYSRHVRIETPDDDEGGIPFTEDDVRRFWEDRADPVAEMLLIMCLSGYRIEEYKTMEIDLDAGTFCGGSKTEAGMHRIVPIHSGLLELVADRLGRYGGKLIPYTSNTFRRKMEEYMTSIRMEIHHTPHDCRHTFSALAEKYHIAENDRKRMLGHALKDITNKVYGHRTVQDLREEIEKIPPFWACCDRVASKMQNMGETQ